MPGFRDYFHPEYGLRAHTAARAVLAQGPLLIGPDGLFWGYANGLWAPGAAGEVEVHNRIVDLLDERYRSHHEKEIRGVLRRMVDRLEVEPTVGYLNFTNGMVRWDAEPEPEHLPHHEQYNSTVQLSVRYVPDARCPEFDAFIARAVAEDDRDRIWEVIGYLMMPGNPLQKMFLMTGGGGNGKGVLLAVLTALLGRRHIANVPLHAFVTDRFAPARLFNTLANVCGDIDTTYIEQTGMIKQLAGEDVIDGDRKGISALSFEYWGKNIFSANGIPASSDSSYGWRRRWEVIDFPNRPKAPDRTLKRRLTAPSELEGIAARAVLALRRLMARGEFAHGAAAAAVHAEFAQRSNKVLQWMLETTHEHPATWYDRPTLVKAFRRWDAYNNPAAKQMGTHKFYEMMRDAWGPETKRRGIYGFGGRQFLSEIAYEQVVDGTPDNDPAENAPDAGGNSASVQETLL